MPSAGRIQLAWGVAVTNAVNLLEGGTTAAGDLVTYSSTGTTTSSSFANMGAPSSVSITKVLAATRLRVDFYTSAWPNAIDTSVEYAILLNGVDHPIAHMMMNANGPHVHASGVRFLPVPAGTYTAQARWRRSGGAGTVTRDVNDLLTMSVQEVM